MHEAVFTSFKKVVYKNNREVSKNQKSRFRGISKIGKKWQVLMMVYQKKRYIGSYVDEEKAARIYDKYAIALFGIQAKPNLTYTRK